MATGAPAPYSALVVQLAQGLENQGWRAFDRFAEDHRHWVSCPSCLHRVLVQTAPLGLGLAYCKPCKIVLGYSIANRLFNKGVQQWPFVYRISLFELVERYPAEMGALAAECGVSATS